MNMTLLSQSSGYVPSYKRTDLTDELHRAFGFRTDYEYLSKAAMRNIVKESKEIKKAKNSTYRREIRNGYTSLNTSGVAILFIPYCQRWDYIISIKKNTSVNAIL